MSIQDPREYSKVLRDPVHGYVQVPQEVLPLVQSQFLQRLRNISQNSRAVAAYPSLTGSRYEHALGTMHLSRLAWANAWANVWDDQSATEPDEYEEMEASRDRLRSEFMNEVRHDVKEALKAPAAFEDPYLRRILDNKERGNSFKDWNAKFTHLMSLAVGVVGLLHDVGHPPFSHVLEDPYDWHAEALIGAPFATNYESYRGKAPNTQFHEYAGSVMLAQILRDLRLTSQLPVTLIWLIFEARDDDKLTANEKGAVLSTWARCVHQLIDGQIDVDRLDYISRDSLRAGADYHAIDRQRLLGNLELHRTTAGKGFLWSVGVGTRGISAIESLLLQREQSYRWMVFHPKALVADTALKRVFDYAITNDKARPDLNYVTAWDNTDSPAMVSTSYGVDDHAVFVWLRQFRNRIAETPSSDAKRHLALMRLFDELSPEYIPAWRTYGEFLDTLQANSDSLWPLILARKQEPSPEGQESKYTETVEQSEDEAARTFNRFVKDAWLSDRNLDITMETYLNATSHRQVGIDGTWLVAQRLNFKPIKSGGLHVWNGNKPILFEQLSPIYAGLKRAEEQRPIIWCFFVPEIDFIDQARAESTKLKSEVSRTFVRAVIDNYRQPG